MLINRILALAEAQMAAEAIHPSGSPELQNLTIKESLTVGNEHNSKFAPTSSSYFSAHWEIVQHQGNTSTGFSGTLLECKADAPVTGAKKGELILSFRSTEFIDDAVRDNKATNTLEIADTGFAWGQIADMQAWYQQLKARGHIPDGAHLSVTGYSLGGHLATAFNLLNPTAADQTVTFNGAGVGLITDGTLQEALDEFNALRSDPLAIAAALTQEPSLQELYLEVRSHLLDGSWTAKKALAYVRSEYPDQATPGDPPRPEAVVKLIDALSDIVSLTNEMARLPTLQSNDGPNPTRPGVVPKEDIAALDLDYRMAVELVAERSEAASKLAGGIQAVGDRAMLPVPAGNTALAHQIDVVADPMPSMVAHSQWHYGTEQRIVIEDQPLYRGGVNMSALAASVWAGLETTLLVDRYEQRDFGDTHSLVLLIDSLSVQTLLLQLLPPAEQPDAQRAFAQILQQASNAKVANGDGAYGDDQGLADGDALENILNNLAQLCLGPEKAPKLTGNTKGNTFGTIDDKDGFSGRESLHACIAQIRQSDLYKAVQNGTVSCSLSANDADLASQARQDFGAFLSLVTLGPFALTLSSTGAALDTLMTAAWGDTWSHWQDNQQNAGTDGLTTLISDEWLTDRAALLARKTYYNLENAAYVATNDLSGNTDGAIGYDFENTIWQDVPSGLTIQRVVANHLTNYVGFGGAGADTLEGADGDDRLYGGAGNDVLDGKGGNNYLEGGDGDDILRAGSGRNTLNGGLGLDTYHLQANTTVLDADGIGQLLFNDQLLRGALSETGRIGEHRWLGALGETYWRVDNDLYLQLPGGNDEATQAVLIRTPRDVEEPLGLFLPTTGPITPQVQTVWTGAATGNQWVAGTTTVGKPWQDTEQAERFIMGKGDDFVLSQWGGDQFFGLAGHDVFIGGAGNNIADGGDGDDTLVEGMTVQRYKGYEWGTSIPTFVPGIGLIPGGPIMVEVWKFQPVSRFERTLHDARVGDFLFHELQGLVQSATVASDDRFYGGAGADWLLGGAGDDLLDGGDGDDVLYGGAGDDELLGGSGNDRISGDNQGGIMLHGMEHGDDYIDAGDGDDVVFGNGGHDIILGGDGNDVLHGDDVLTAAQYHGYDVLFGGAGNDRLYGDGGDDELYGEEGNDLLVGGNGNDYLSGGDGNDRLVGDAPMGADQDSTPVMAAIHGAMGDYLRSNLKLLMNLAVVDKLVDAPGDDVLEGGDGDDDLLGGGGADMLRGGNGSDTYWYFKGDGHDIIEEEAGRPGDTDTLILCEKLTVGMTQVQRVGDDMVLRWNDENTITVRDQFGTQGPRLECLRFDNGHSWSAAELELYSQLTVVVPIMLPPIPYQYDVTFFPTAMPAAVVL